MVSRSCPVQGETTLERSPAWFRVTQVHDYITGTRAPQVPAGLYGIYYGVRAAPNWQMAKGQAYQAWKSAKKYGREPWKGDAHPLYSSLVTWVPMRWGLPVVTQWQIFLPVQPEWSPPSQGYWEKASRHTRSKPHNFCTGKWHCLPRG